MKSLFQTRAPLISTLLLFLLCSCSTPPSPEQRSSGKVDCGRVGEVMDDVATRGRIKNADDLRAFEKSGVQSPKGVDAFGDRTLPMKNKPQDLEGTMRDPFEEGLDEATRGGRLGENEALKALSDKGYKVKVLPEKPGGNGSGRLKPDGTPGTGNPDALVNNTRVFDVYSPTSPSVRNVSDEIAKKVGKQARRILLNLNRAPFETGDIVKHLQENPIDDLIELMVYKEGQFGHYFPY